MTDKMGIENPETSDFCAFLFLVNPRLHYNPYPDWQRWLPLVRRGKSVELEWNTGSRRRGMKSGDLALMVKVGQDPRGLVAYGTVESEIYEAPHWNPDAAQPVTGWVSLCLTGMLDLDAPLPLSILKEVDSSVRWTPRMSGTRIPYGTAIEVIELAKI